MAVTESVISAASGLLGVAVGAYLTQRGESVHRKLAFLERRLNEFYSPMLGLHKEIATESRLRVLIQDVGDRAWRELTSSDRNPQDTHKRFEDFKKLIDYDNKKFSSELLPSYKRMLTLFRDHLSLAYPDTIAHFDKLVKFVGVWDRFMNNAIPREAVILLEHTEKDIRFMPIYNSTMMSWSPR